MNKPESVLDQANLKQHLQYDQETGVFIRLQCKAGQIKPGSIAGKVGNRGYLQIKLLGKMYQAHRLAWLYCYGRFPDDLIDHIDHDTLNNRIDNLREVNANGNMHNYIKPNSNNKLGYLGVSACGNKLQAEIKTYGKRKYLGSFNTPEEAHAAYVVAKRELHPTCTL